MATKHWVRDVNFPSGFGNYSGNQLRANAVWFHFLRNAGFDWLWECDGDKGPQSEVPNHIDDGDMQNPGVANWTAIGGGIPAVAKDTTIFWANGQSLKVDATAIGDGVQSDPMFDMKAPVNSQSLNTGDSLSGPTNGLMRVTDTGNPFGEANDLLGTTFVMAGSSQPTNNGEFPVVNYVSNSQIDIYNPAGVAEGYTTGVYEPTMVQRYKYELDIWAYNNSGNTWNVEVDRGDGAPTVIGNIPHNAGVWTRYHFTFHVLGAGTVDFRVVATVAAAQSIYLGAALCYRSAWEYLASDHYAYTGGGASIIDNGGVPYSDGILTNPDQFSTAGSYTPGVQDIGKHLVVWDTTNNKNSGVYEIIADLGGGVVQVDMRSPTATFTNQGGLQFRIVLIHTGVSTGGPLPQGSPMSDSQMSCGFGLESPHASAWRFFLRMNFSAGQVFKNAQLWSAPDDSSDYSVDTGYFFKNGASIMRNRARGWTRNISGGGSTPNIHTTGGGYSSSGANNRVFLMTDVDLSFVHFINYDVTGNKHQSVLMGYLGTDAQHPGIMAFYHFSPWTTGVNQNELNLMDDLASRFGTYGTGFKADGLAVRSALGQLGFGTTTADVQDQTQSKANPFSGREWVHDLFIAQDPTGSEQAGGEMDSNCGVFQGRTTLTPIATFDSEAYLHFANGICWEWSGEQIL